MSFINDDEAQQLAAILYPSIEASGNVYYGQTRKLALDSIFNQKFINYFIEDERIVMVWELGPLRGAFTVYKELYYDEVYFIRYKLKLTHTDESNIIHSGKFNSYSWNIELDCLDTDYISIGAINPITVDTEIEEAWDGRDFYICKDKDDSSAAYLYLAVSDKNTKHRVYNAMHPSKELLEQPLTFHIENTAEAGGYIRLNKTFVGPINLSYTLANKYEYRIKPLTKSEYDDWKSFDGKYASASGEYVQSPLLNAGDSLQLRCIKDISAEDCNNLRYINISFINLSGTYLSGNIASLIYSDFARSDLHAFSYSHYRLFKNLNLYDAEDLIIPYAIVEVGAFRECFASCHNLRTAPSILTKSVINKGSISDVDGHFQYMFSDCTSLADPPAILPVTNTRVSESPSTYIYSHMFNECNALRYPPLISYKLSSSEYSSFDHIFYNCNNMRRLPSMLTTTFNNLQYDSSEAIGLHHSHKAYNESFVNCRSANYFYCAAASDSDEYSSIPDNWLTGCNPRLQLIIPDKAVDEIKTSYLGIVAEANLISLSDLLAEPELGQVRNHACCDSAVKIIDRDNNSLMDVTKTNVTASATSLTLSDSFILSTIPNDSITYQPRRLSVIHSDDLDINYIDSANNQYGLCTMSNDLILYSQLQGFAKHTARAILFENDSPDEVRFYLEYQHPSTNLPTWVIKDVSINLDGYVDTLTFTIDVYSNDKLVQSDFICKFTEFDGLIGVSSLPDGYTYSYTGWFSLSDIAGALYSKIGEQIKFSLFTLADDEFLKGSNNIRIGDDHITLRNSQVEYEFNTEGIYPSTPVRLGSSTNPFSSIKTTSITSYDTKCTIATTTGTKSTATMVIDSQDSSGTMLPSPKITLLAKTTNGNKSNSIEITEDEITLSSSPIIQGTSLRDLINNFEFRLHPVAHKFPDSGYKTIKWNNYDFDNTTKCVSSNTALVNYNYEGSRCLHSKYLIDRNSSDPHPLRSKISSTNQFYYMSVLSRDYLSEYSATDNFLVVERDTTRYAGLFLKIKPNTNGGTRCPADVYMNDIHIEHIDASTNNTFVELFTSCTYLTVVFSATASSSAWFTYGSDLKVSVGTSSTDTELLTNVVFSRSSDSDQAWKSSRTAYTEDYYRELNVFSYKVNKSGSAKFIYVCFANLYPGVRPYYITIDAPGEMFS